MAAVDQRQRITALGRLSDHVSKAEKYVLVIEILALSIGQGSGVNYL